MPADTPILDIPYPLAADAITDYPALAQDVAELLETYLLEELAYAQVTADVPITNTGGAPDTVVTAPAVTFDGATIALVEFSCPLLERGNIYTRVCLYENGVQKGIIAQATSGSPGYGAFRFTPTAGAKTYSIRAYVDTSTGYVRAGTGAGNTLVPATIRVSKILS